MYIDISLILPEKGAIIKVDEKIIKSRDTQGGITNK